MYTLVTLTVVGLLAGAFHYVRSRSEYRDCCAYCFVGLCAGCILGLLVGLTLMSIQPTRAQKDCYDLCSMSTTETTSGTFFLGTGSVDGYMVYRVYIKGCNGGMYPWWVRANMQVSIFENAKLNAGGTLIIRYQHKDERWWLAKWALPQSDCNYTYEFDIPSGSFNHNKFQVN